MGKKHEDSAAGRGATEGTTHQSKPVDGIELVFGLVGPTGVDLTAVCNALRSQLTAVGYEPIIIRLSELIPWYCQQSFDPKSEYDRIKELMSMGTALREKTKQPDIIGRLGIAKIQAVREERHGDGRVPLPRVAYIVRSFKRPEEVELYRTVYGKAFTLLSVYSPRAARV